MWNRRQFVSRGTASLLGLGAGLLPARAADNLGRDALPDGSAAKGMITPETQNCIDRGLAFLARHQDKADFSFGTSLYKGNVAVTSLAGLAFMSGGHQPGRGRYGDVVSGAVEFILKQESRGRPGYLHNVHGSATPHGPMYGHGFGTLFLAEVYGMVHNRKLREKLRGTLERAVDLIVASQNSEGGWRYQPEPKDADISVTICQIMALRAARNVGFSMPRSVVDRCTKYVKRCQDHEGGFRYMAQGGGSAFARTAAGVVALFSAGEYKGPEVEKGLRYLMNYKPGQAFFARNNEMHYFYGHYYAVQAMWTAGGNYWAEWYPAIRDELIRHPRLRGDGSWIDQICYHYGTAMACIILQVPNNYLSILQK
jgi:hypothetical protein